MGERYMARASRSSAVRQHDGQFRELASAGSLGAIALKSITAASATDRRPELRAKYKTLRERSCRTPCIRRSSRI
eukprot:9049424-Pyramimonas_sp.AAC.1